MDADGNQSRRHSLGVWGLISGCVVLFFGATWLYNRYQGSGPVVARTIYDDKIVEYHKIFGGARTERTTLRKSEVTPEVQKMLRADRLFDVLGALPSEINSSWSIHRDFEQSGRPTFGLKGTFRGDSVAFANALKSKLDHAQMAFVQQSIQLRGQAKASKKEVFLMLDRRGQISQDEVSLYLQMR